jgi:hypothetical protein
MLGDMAGQGSNMREAEFVLLRSLIMNRGWLVAGWCT